MDALEFALKYHSGGDRLRRWLRHLYVSGSHIGGALVDLYGQHPPVGDNVARVDQVLRILRDAGWIIQGGKAPTLSLAAFDFSGERRADRSGFYASWHTYTPNMDSEGLRNYVESST